MLKLALGIALVAGAFAGALYAGGNVMGAWEPYRPEPQGKRPEAGRQAEPTERRSRSRRRARPRVAGRRAGAPRDTRWIRRANALCVEAHRHAAATRPPRTLQEMQAFLARGTKDNRHWNQRFLRLGAPRGAAARFRRLRSLFREDEALLAELAAAIRQEDATSLLFLSRELVDLARRESNLLVSLGARECVLPEGAVI